MLGSTVHSSAWRASPGYVCLACRRAQARVHRSQRHQIRWNSQQYHDATDASADSWFETFNDISDDFGSSARPLGKKSQEKAKATSSKRTTAIDRFSRGASTQDSKQAGSKYALDRDGRSKDIPNSDGRSKEAVDTDGKSSAVVLQDGKSEIQATSKTGDQTGAKAAEKTQPQMLDLNAKFGQLMGSLQSKITGKDSAEKFASNRPGRSVLETLDKETPTRPPSRARRLRRLNYSVEPTKYAVGTMMRADKTDRRRYWRERMSESQSEKEIGVASDGDNNAASAAAQPGSSVATASSALSTTASSFDIPQLQSLIDKLQTEAKVKAAEQDETITSKLASQSKIPEEVDHIDSEPRPMPFFNASADDRSPGRVRDLLASENARTDPTKSNIGGYSGARSVKILKVLQEPAEFRKLAVGPKETVKARPMQSSNVEATAQPSQAISQLLNLTKQSSPMRLVDRHRQHLQELVPFGMMKPKGDASGASFNSLRNADKVTPQTTVSTATNDAPYGLASQLEFEDNKELMPKDLLTPEQQLTPEHLSLTPDSMQNNPSTTELATVDEEHVAHAQLSRLYAELKPSPDTKKTPEAPASKKPTSTRKTRRERLQKLPPRKTSSVSERSDSHSTMESNSGSNDQSGTSDTAAGLSIAEAMMASTGQSGGKHKKRSSSAVANDDHEPESLSSAAPTESAPPSSEALNSLSPSDLVIEPLDLPQPHVPFLQYGLDRVLFNPGVYQLQDLESRVYNFDPYLQKIMPVMEFDFNALKEYKTSSQDVALSTLAQEHDKKYIGSTSSMTSSLAHFHYLLSNWRPLNLGMLSKGFVGKSMKDTFTEINRAPSAIFLRWKNGTYAIDADKEYDSPNVLMLLGKSMELLLTLPKADFERYRKSDPRQVTEEERTAPEAYQYTTMGDFLMRSQLDASDPRLPGNGTFDLKTRAVVSVRMDSEEFESMSGYEIYQSQGKWGSYEREYYDMMRSTMLKYMLQARMGRMNGIFVAYHNVKRMFGFQFIPMAEMDRALHGQRDTCLGDQEFKASLGMLNELLDKATAKFPEQSLRIHFEARPGEGGGMPTALHVFAEPMEEMEIERIQNSQKARIAAWERQIMGKDDEPTAETDNDSASVPRDADVSNEIDLDASPNGDHTEIAVEHSQTAGEQEQDIVDTDSGNTIDADLSTATGQDVSDRDFTGGVSNDANADTAFLDSINSDLKPLFHATIIAQSRVNGGNPTGDRPEDLKSTDKWEIDYILKEYETTSSQWALYEDTKARRKYALSHEAEDEDESALDGRKQSYYIKFLRDMSEKGSQLRERIDELEVRDEVVRVDDHLPTHREKVEGVDDYMAWLYRK